MVRANKMRLRRRAISHHYFRHEQLHQRVLNELRRSLSPFHNLARLDLESQPLRKKVRSLSIEVGTRCSLPCTILCLDWMFPHHVFQQTSLKREALSSNATAAWLSAWEHRLIMLATHMSREGGSGWEDWPHSVTSISGRDRHWAVLTRTICVEVGTTWVESTPKRRR